jgi:hypothetical protein
VRSSVVPPYAAYLRIYEPLTAFSASERTEWEAFLAARDGAPSGEAAAANEGGGGEANSGTVAASTASDLAAEHRRTLSRLVALPPIPVPATEERLAYVMTIDGAPLVCPWQERLRSWIALGQARRELPPSLLDACLPPAVIKRAESEHEVWRQLDTDTQPHILTATYQPPMAWFMLFSGAERILHLGVGADRVAKYRTPISHARRRAALSLRTLRRARINAPMAAAVERLARWLEEFHAKSYVELDYAGLVALWDDQGLMADRSVADVASGLEALERGDADGALEAYRALSERWRPITAYQSAN